MEGNVIKDKEAKKQAKLPPIPRAKTVQTLSNAKRRINKGKDNAWQLECQTDGGSEALQTYKDFTPATRRKSLPELNMKLEVLGWLIAARSGRALRRI